MGGEFARRFVGPLRERLFPGWPDLAYAEAARADALPPNVELCEFFLSPGPGLNASQAQRG